jgi:hypothetical protein
VPVFGSCVPKVSRRGRAEMDEGAGYFVTARAATRRRAKNA